MSEIQTYTLRSFNPAQKFLVYDPSNGTTSLVLGSSLVNYIAPNLSYVFTDTTRASAVTKDYQIGQLIQTAGGSTIGDGGNGMYLVVAAGDGDYAMINGNELLLLPFGTLAGSDLDGATVTDAGETVNIEDAIARRDIGFDSIVALYSSNTTAEYVYTRAYTSGGTVGSCKFVQTATGQTPTTAGTLLTHLAAGYVVNAAGVKYSISLDQVIRPEMFGVLGDGLTVDNTQLGVADTFAATIGVRLRGRSGATYILNAGITFSAEWDVNGATFKTSAAGTDRLITTTAFLCNGKFDGVIVKVDDDSADVKVKGNELYNATVSASAVILVGENTDRVQIKANKIHDFGTGSDASGDSSGIKVDSRTSSSVYARDLDISDNEIYSGHSQDVKHIWVRGVDGGRFNNNVCRDVQAKNIYGLNIDDGSNYVASGNQVRDYTLVYDGNDDDGIYVVSAFACNRCEFFNVSDNRFRSSVKVVASGNFSVVNNDVDYEEAQWYNGNGLEFDGIHWGAMTIKGNTIVHGLRGVGFDKNYDDTTVSGVMTKFGELIISNNEFIDCYNNGIQFGKPAGRVSINNNIIRSLIDTNAVSQYKHISFAAAWKVSADTGTHNGSANAATLSDSTAAWTTDCFKGWTLQNTTDGSSGVITANTATTITATLSGGSDNDWDVSDAYNILAPGRCDVGQNTIITDKVNVSSAQNIVGIYMLGLGAEGATYNFYDNVFQFPDNVPSISYYRHYNLRSLTGYANVINGRFDGRQIDVAGTSAFDSGTYAYFNKSSVQYVDNATGAGAPSAGAWTRGQKLLLVSPSASGTEGYVCVTSGSPGTWKTFGSIAA